MTYSREDILKNIGWLVLDKIFILVLQFFIGVKIANYYGSFLYGKYNYVLSIVAFSSIFFELINGRVVKKYYTEDNYGSIVFNITFFRNSIAIILFIISLLTIWWIRIDKISYCILIFLALDNVLITSTMGIENYYEYTLNVKKIVISNNIVKIISYLLQYIGIVFNFTIIIVPIIRCFGSFIRMLLLKYSYKKILKNSKKYKLDINLLKKMIRESFYLWSAFVAFIVYTQVDKIMLGIMIGKKEVGIYSIALQLINVILIVLTPLQTILFTKMLSLYKLNYEDYIKYYFKMNILITYFYIVTIFISIFILKNTFNYVFDIEYNDAIVIYQILTIGVLMKANGALQTGHMTLKNITKKAFYKTSMGLLINLILNYLLIKKYGILGAAWSTSITQVFTLFIFDFFINEYREQAFIQLKSFNIFYFFKCGFTLKDIKIKKN